MVQMSRLDVNSVSQTRLVVLAQLRQRQRPLAVAELRGKQRERQPHSRETDSGSGLRE